MIHTLDSSIWEKSLLQLEDNVFFLVLKNYLGKIETPFHKPQLIQRLKKFISRPEIQDKIAALIDNNDRIIISCIERLRQPGKNEIYQFLENQFSFSQLHFALQNLEERLIIFEFEGIFFINPLLRSVLEKQVLDQDWSIESRSREQNSPPLRPWLTEQRFLCICGYLARSEDPQTKEGKIKPRHLNEIIRTIMPEAEIPNIENIQSQENVNTIFKASCLLGFFKNKQAKTEFDSKRLQEFGKLKPKDRIIHIWSAYIAASWETDRPDTVPQTNEAMQGNAYLTFSSSPPLAAINSIVSSLLGSLPGDMEYSKTSILGLLLNSSNPIDNIAHKKILKILGQLCAIIEHKGWISISPWINLKAEFEESRQPIIFSSGTTFSLSSNYCFEALMRPAVSGEALSVDYVAEFTISKESFCIGSNFFTEPIKNLFEQFSQSMPQTTRFILDQWTEQIDQIIVRRGICLEVTEKYIPDFESLIEGLAIISPTPGIYIIDENEYSILYNRLKTRGMQLMLSEKLVNNEQTDENYGFLPTRLTAFKPVKEHPLDIPDREMQAPRTAADANPLFIDELYSTLGKSKMKPLEKEEIDRKIRSRLILTSDQITPEICRKDKTEARGIDFQGKINIIQQTLQSREDLLGVTLLGNKEGDKEFLIVPLQITSKNEQRELSGKLLPNEEDFKCQVREISRIRRVRKSLYT